MSKTVYYTHPLKNGGYFDAVIVPDGFELPAQPYPFTDIAIPNELQTDGCVPRFNWATHLWEDATSDAQVAKELKRDQDLAAAQDKAIDAHKLATAASETANTAAGAVTELMDYVSTLPTTTATDTTNTEETTNA